MSPKISVIIPVYGVEAFLPLCVESLLAQTMPEIEYIFVNDASPDGCPEILRGYQAQHPEQIVVIDSPENRRQGGARNLGLHAARAPYVGFVDGDDFAAPAMFARLYEKMQATDADAVFCQYAGVPEDADAAPADSKPFLQWKPELLAWDNVPLTDQGVCDLLAYPIGGIWSGLWKKSVLTENNIRFPEKIRYEDNYWAALVKCYLKKVAFVPEILYYYRQNASSTVHQRNARYQIEDRIRIERSLLEEVQQRGLLKRFYPAWEYLYTSRYGITTMDFACYIFDVPPADELAAVMQDVQAMFPNWEKNPYYQKAYTEEQQQRNRRMVQDPMGYIRARQKEKRQARRREKRMACLVAMVARVKKMLGLEQVTLTDLVKKH